MPKMQSRQVSRDARLARGNGRARHGSRLTMLASETASTLPREGAEQRSSTIAYQSVACAASSGLSACPTQTIPGLRNGAQKASCQKWARKVPLCGLRFVVFFSLSASLRPPRRQSGSARASLLHASLLTIYLPLSVWSPVRVLPLIKIDAHNPLSSCV